MLNPLSSSPHTPPSRKCSPSYPPPWAWGPAHFSRFRLVNNHNRLYMFKQFQKVLGRGKPPRTSNGSVKCMRHLKEQTLTFPFPRETESGDVSRERTVESKGRKDWDKTKTYKTSSESIGTIYYLSLLLLSVGVFGECGWWTIHNLILAFITVLH